MMRYFSKILFAASAVCVFSCSQSGFSIKGHFGHCDGQAVLAYSDPDGGSVRDTVPIRSGSFTFTGEVSEPVTAVTYLIPEGEKPISFRLVLEDGRIKVDIHPEDVIENSHDRRNINNPKITGSPNNDFVTGQVAVKAKVGADPRFASVYAEDIAVHSEGSASPDYDARIKKYNREFADIIPAYSAAVDSAMVAYALANPDIEMAAQLFSVNADYLSNEEYEAAFNTFTPEVQQSSFAERLRSRLSARMSTEPGSLAPDFTLKNPDGKDVTLSSFRGQYVLLDFWASWCIPCRKSMPAMKELYAKYHDKGFEIIGITNDSKADAWKQALEEDQTPWVHVIDEFPERGKGAVVISKYRAGTLPTYFLLDKDGKIIARLEHEEIEPKLVELLGE